jgi:hypothetical protein
MRFGWRKTWNPVGLPPGSGMILFPDLGSGTFLVKLSFIFFRILFSIALISSGTIKLLKRAPENHLIPRVLFRFRDGKMFGSRSGMKKVGSGSGLKHSGFSTLNKELKPDLVDKIERTLNRP